MRSETAVSINGGAAYTGTTAVTASITASDSGGSGLSAMRFRRSGEMNFGSWMPFALISPLSLFSGDGPQTVEAQVRDGAGNKSRTVTDQIVLDHTAPAVTSFTVNGGRSYVAPGEGVTITLVATDAGSGLDSLAVTYDNGTTWTPWAAAPGPAAVDRPTGTGVLPVRVRARDVLGNVSTMSAATPVFFLEPDPPFLGTGGAFTGGMSARTDVDAVGIDLVVGDLLTVKLKATGTDKKAGFPLVFDLTNPDGTRLVTGVTSISGFAATYTGRHLLVLRLADATGPGTGTYGLSVKVKLGAANAKGKGSWTGQFTFAAADGGLLKARLAGPGLDPTSVVVEGPEGVAATTVAGKPGSAKLTTTLNRGTGTYTVRYTATGAVTASWSVKLPKGPTIAE